VFVKVRDRVILDGGSVTAAVCCVVVGRVAVVAVATANLAPFHTRVRGDYHCCVLNCILLLVACCFW